MDKETEYDNEDSKWCLRYKNANKAALRHGLVIEYDISLLVARINENVVYTSNSADEMSVFVHGFLKGRETISKLCPDCYGDGGFGDHLGWVGCTTCCGSGKVKK